MIGLSLSTKEHHPAARKMAIYRGLGLAITVVGLALTCGCSGPNQPSPSSAASGGVIFTDIAKGGGGGLAYHRSPSVTEAFFEAQKQQPLYTGADMVKSPVKSRGAPGVAILDFDNDGDLDIYVTNGPGTSNSLFSNQLKETGQFRFIDVATSAGVGAKEQDSLGVCFGDIDNDGDLDLYVLGRGESNRLYENQGNGTFVEITGQSGTAAGNYTHTSCSMGDINGDGLLDIFVSNTFDWSSGAPLLAVPFDNHPNQMFVNTGKNRFSDVSTTSGIRDLKGYLPENDGKPTISWTVALIDYDLDGILDIVEGDGQGGYPRAKDGGVDRGAIHILKNDGTGKFHDVSAQLHTLTTGQWMGLAFGDINHDGRMDIWGSNFGDWAISNLSKTYSRGDSTSRWFLGQADGTFSDVGVGGLVATPFGWGAAMLDSDNDGHTDIAYVGGFDLGPYVDASNPGTILRNDGSGNFVFDKKAMDASLARKNSQGLAVGDLNGDGFTDIVTASSFDFPEPLPLLPYAKHYGSPFDPETASYVPTFTPVDGGNFKFSGIKYADGSLSVLVNSGQNGNRALTVRAVGSVGLVSRGKVNRAGIGAILLVTPEGGQPAMFPVTSGGSYESQNSLDGVFGLGAAGSATVEIVWPGKVRNRLYDVKAGERLVFPEIPCSTDEPDGGSYQQCVTQALAELRAAKLLSDEQVERFRTSAQRAFSESHSTRP